MEKNYTNSSLGSQMPSQPPSHGVSMKTKLRLAKIGLAICIIILILAKSIAH